MKYVSQFSNIFNLILFVQHWFTWCIWICLGPSLSAFGKFDEWLIEMKRNKKFVVLGKQWVPITVTDFLHLSAWFFACNNPTQNIYIVKYLHVCSQVSNMLPDLFHTLANINYRSPRMSCFSKTSIFYNDYKNLLGNWFSFKSP